MGTKSRPTSAYLAILTFSRMVSACSLSPFFFINVEWEAAHTVHGDFFALASRTPHSLESPQYRNPASEEWIL